MIKKLYIPVLLLLLITATQSLHAAQPLGTSDRYSEWLTRSEMKRVPNSYLLDFSSKPKWSYVMGIELESMLDTYLRYGGDDIKKYCKDYTDKMISSSGSITGYSLSDYNLDNVRTGHFVTSMYLNFPEEKNLKAIKTLMKQLEDQPRTKAGPYWHKAIYHDQVWLDGIFMGLPFRVLTAANIPGICTEAEAKAIYDDAVDQVTTTYEKTLDPTTGLNRHAWDETHSMFWADKETGLSQHCWGRAQGWYTMALVELLDALPESYERRGELVDLLVKCFDAELKWQDPATHTWFQVMDSPERENEGNYREATCSAMLTYAMLKASRKGWVDKKYMDEGLKAYDGLVKQFIVENSDGTISLTKCCEVGGLGPENKPKRDGSFKYYLSENVRNNDAKGVGPFIWASLEREAIVEAQTSLSINEASTEDLPVEIYNLQGTRMAVDKSHSLPSGIYISRQGNNTTKFISGNL